MFHLFAHCDHCCRRIFHIWRGRKQPGHILCRDNACFHPFPSAM